jgi:hypothetical protein
MDICCPLRSLGQLRVSVSIVVDSSYWHWMTSATPHVYFSIDEAFGHDKQKSTETRMVLLTILPTESDCRSFSSPYSLHCPPMGIL